MSGEVHRFAFLRVSTIARDYVLTRRGRGVLKCQGRSGALAESTTLPLKIHSKICYAKHGLQPLFRGTSKGVRRIYCLGMRLSGQTLAQRFFLPQDQAFLVFKKTAGRDCSHQLRAQRFFSACRPQWRNKQPGYGVNQQRSANVCTPLSSML